MLTYAGLSSTVTIGQVTVIPVGSLTIANLKITFGGSIVQPGDYIPVNAPNTEIKIVGDMTNPNPVDVKWYVMSALRVPSGGAFSYGTGPSFTNLAQGATATAVTLAVFGQVAQVDPLSGPPITLTYSVVLQMRVGIDDYTQEVATGTLIAYHAVAPTVTPTW